MHNFQIVSSSFLLPNTKKFTILKNTVNHSHFNDFSFVNKKTKNEIIYYIFFLKDFLDENSFKSNKRKISLIFSRIENLLKKDMYFVLLKSFFIQKNILNDLKVVDLNEEKISNLINKKLNFLKKKYNNFFVVDLDYIFNLIGNNIIFDHRNWYLFKCHLSQKGLETIYSTIFEVYKKIFNVSKKILVLDCDNTLWGGVVGELGPEKIEISDDGIGRAYQDFQKKIKFLKERGLILAISSKNNEKDVIEVFKKNKNMILKENDFVSLKINWKEKSLNIKEISDELNINLDSFVFWDDNPVEREKVKRNLRDVLVPDVGEDVFNWPDKIINMNCFGKPIITTEDLNKTKQYKSRSLFLNDLKKYEKEEQKYLRSINMKATFQKISNKSISRCVQMCEKTNQFNLTTIRHKEDFFKKYMNSKNHIIEIVSLKDDYGDHGIVGLYIVEINDKTKKASLNTFLMSCRILGRKLEFLMIQNLLNKLLKNKILRLNAQYIKTKKNIIAQNFLIESNFVKLKKNNYFINTNQKLKNVKNIFKK